jgi:hypothetical protein
MSNPSEGVTGVAVPRAATYFGGKDPSGNLAGFGFDAGGNLITASSSGITASAIFTPAAAAYSANDIMSVAQPFVFTYADGSAIPAGSLIRILTAVVKIDETSLQASEGAYALQCYSVTPPSAQADNAAWSLASADLPSYRGSITLGTPAALGAAVYVKSSSLDLDIKLTAAGTLYAQLQTLAGFTTTAIARQIFLYGLVL